MWYKNILPTFFVLFSPQASQFELTDVAHLQFFLHLCLIGVISLTRCDTASPNYESDTFLLEFFRAQKKTCAAPVAVVPVDGGHVVAQSEPLGDVLPPKIFLKNTHNMNFHIYIIFKLLIFFTWRLPSRPRRPTRSCPGWSCPFRRRPSCVIFPEKFERKKIGANNSSLSCRCLFSFTHTHHAIRQHRLCLIRTEVFFIALPQSLA